MIRTTLNYYFWEQLCYPITSHYSSSTQHPAVRVGKDWKKKEGGRCYWNNNRLIDDGLVGCIIVLMKINFLAIFSQLPWAHAVHLHILALLCMNLSYMWELSLCTLIYSIINVWCKRFQIKRKIQQNEMF